MVLLSMLCRWQDALVIVKPATFVKWHRHVFRLLWRWKSRTTGRPPVTADVVAEIRRIASENPLWSPRRIQNELALKIGISLSPQTIKKYMPASPDGSTRHGRGDQRWATFVRNHARAIVAGDFFTVVTASFRTLYVFVIMEIGSRKILHCNITSSPTSQWTQQQLREAIDCDHQYRFLIHDRHSIFNNDLDETVKRLGLRPLRTPIRSPQANAYCERLIGTIRRECLDYLIPLSENHLRYILREWVDYYNTARPHMSLGPGIPSPPDDLPVKPSSERHQIRPGHRIVSKPVLGGLHHEYWLEEAAA
jgi:transposase InsO family protein